MYIYTHATQLIKHKGHSIIEKKHINRLDSIPSRAAKCDEGRKGCLRQEQLVTRAPQKHGDSGGPTPRIHHSQDTTQQTEFPRPSESTTNGSSQRKTLGANPKVVQTVFPDIDTPEGMEDTPR